MPSLQKTQYFRSSNRIFGTACLAAILWGGSAAAALPAAEAPSADLLQLITDLVSDPDKEMRAMPAAQDTLRRKLQRGQYHYRHGMLYLLCYRRWRDLRLLPGPATARQSGFEGRSDGFQSLDPGV